jgi:hypothetical protein
LCLNPSNPRLYLTKGSPPAMMTNGPGLTNRDKARMMGYPKFQIHLEATWFMLMKGINFLRSASGWL